MSMLLRDQRRALFSAWLAAGGGYCTRWRQFRHDTRHRRRPIDGMALYPVPGSTMTWSLAATSTPRSIAPAWPSLEVREPPAITHYRRLKPRCLARLGRDLWRQASAIFGAGSRRTAARLAALAQDGFGSMAADGCAAPKDCVRPGIAGGRHARIILPGTAAIGAVVGVNPLFSARPTNNKTIASGALGKTGRRATAAPVDAPVQPLDVPQAGQHFCCASRVVDMAGRLSMGRQKAPSAGRSRPCLWCITLAWRRVSSAVCRLITFDDGVAILPASPRAGSSGRVVLSARTTADQIRSAFAVRFVPSRPMINRGHAVSMKNNIPFYRRRQFDLEFAVGGRFAWVKPDVAIRTGQPGSAAPD